MAGTPESVIVAHIRAALRREGAWEFKTHGSMMQARGLPDIICCYRGVFVALEVKRPGGHPTPIQTEVLERIRAAGGVAEVVTSVQEATDVLRESVVRFRGH